MAKEEIQHCLVLIKPDALIHSLTGFILTRLSETGLIYAAAKIVRVNRELAEEHYAVHRGKPFFPDLIRYITGEIHYPGEPEKRRVEAIVYHGPGAIALVREKLGATNPNEARLKAPQAIRSQFGAVIGSRDAAGQEYQRFDNVCHASDSPESAAYEIKLWLRPADIPPGLRIYPTVVADQHFYLTPEKRLTGRHQPGGHCLVGPGEEVWESDWRDLKAWRDGKGKPALPLSALAAKYRINLGE